MVGQPGGVLKAEGQPENPADLRDNGTLAYTQICHKTYYKPGDVESIILIGGAPQGLKVWEGQI